MTITAQVSGKGIVYRKPELPIHSHSLQRRQEPCMGVTMEQGKQNRDANRNDTSGDPVRSKVETLCFVADETVVVMKCL